jgi:DNA-directed RNA polymerase subunit B
MRINHPIQNTTSHQETLTKQQWLNKPWAFTEQTSTTVDSRSHNALPTVPMVQTENMDVMDTNNAPRTKLRCRRQLRRLQYGRRHHLQQSIIERGLARSTFYRIYEAECRQYLGGLKDKFTVPEPGTRGYRGEQYYRLLEPDGIISLESQVVGGDVLIGRISPPRFLEEYKEFEVKDHQCVIHQ